MCSAKHYYCHTLHNNTVFRCVRAPEDSTNLDNIVLYSTVQFCIVPFYSPIKSCLVLCIGQFHIYEITRSNLDPEKWRFFSTFSLQYVHRSTKSLILRLVLPIFTILWSKWGKFTFGRLNVKLANTGSILHQNQS